MNDIVQCTGPSMMDRGRTEVVVGESVTCNVAWTAHNEQTQSSDTICCYVLLTYVWCFRPVHGRTVPPRASKSDVAAHMNLCVVQRCCSRVGGVGGIVCDDDVQCGCGAPFFFSSGSVP